MQKTGGNKVKLLGYCLLGLAGWTCCKAGLGIDRWEFWVVVTGLIVGSNLTRWEDREK